NPDKATQGHPGVGSQGHLGGIYFQKLTGTRFQHVPYRGLTFAMQDLVAGQIDMVFPDPASALPLVRSGRIKAFAVAGNRRSAARSHPRVRPCANAGSPRNLSPKPATGRDDICATATKRAQNTGE